MTLIYFILLLSVIVIIHEFGHLLAAKAFNVYCQEFSVGMGPISGIQMKITEIHTSWWSG